MKLPKVLYAKIDQDGDDAFVVASVDLADCVEDGEVNLIGTYLLKDSRKYEKVVSARD